jgi:hypothetical protein
VLQGEKSYVHSEDEISHFHCDYVLGFKAFVLSAQSLASGDITGTVTDSSGGFMPKVNVALKNTGTAKAGGQRHCPFVSPLRLIQLKASSSFET